MVEIGKTPEAFYDIMVVYMSSSLLQLAPEVCDLSQTEKRITVL